MPRCVLRSVYTGGFASDDRAGVATETDCGLSGSVGARRYNNVETINMNCELCWYWLYYPDQPCDDEDKRECNNKMISSSSIKLAEDCELLQADESACDTCACYIACWGEFPWTAARVEYDGSRGV